MPDEVTIYSDGGADPNPGIGGWAALLRSGEHERVLTGNDPKTTNNRMELQAAIAALRALKRPCRVSFHTDSQYLRRGITEGVAKWRAAGWVKKNGQAIPNADLWRELQSLTAQHDITWHWVQGHSGDEGNETVDRLAREARLPGAASSIRSARRRSCARPSKGCCSCRRAARPKCSPRPTTSSRGRRAGWRAGSAAAG